MPRLLVLCAWLVWAGAALAAKGYGGPHLDGRLVPPRCGACHAGHGRSRSPMMRATGDGLCLRCHGAPDAREAEAAAGRLARGARPASVAQEIRKAYRHPTERSAYHQAGEGTGLAAGEVPRHAACVDCHDPHAIPPREPRSLLGLRPRASPLAGVATEADLCFRCHGQTASRVSRARDISLQFERTATSSHAVLAAGLPRRVPSLVAPWVATSILSCGDCHGSDDPSAARGPHGSAYAFLLRERYETTDGMAESEDRYALCYRCHSRRSILANESFARHSSHILGQGSQGARGASCRACHSAHGSTRYPGLIDFDPTVVMPDRFGRLAYEPGVRGGQCRLTCHDVEHPISTGKRPYQEPLRPRLPIAPGVPLPRPLAPRGGGLRP